MCLHVCHAAVPEFATTLSGTRFCGILHCSLPYRPTCDSHQKRPLMGSGRVSCFSSSQIQVVKKEKEQGIWGFKALKQMMKLLFAMAEYREFSECYTRLLGETIFASSFTQVHRRFRCFFLGRWCWHFDAAQR